MAEHDDADASGGPSWLARLLYLTCRQAAPLQAQARHQSLSGAERVGLRLHVLSCRWCRRYGAQLSFLRTAFGRGEQPPSPAQPRGLSPEARARIERALSAIQK